MRLSRIFRRKAFLFLSLSHCSFPTTRLYVSQLLFNSRSFYVRSFYDYRSTMVNMKSRNETKLALLQLLLQLCYPSRRNVLIYARLRVAESGNLTEKGFESRRASETLIEKVPPLQFVAFVTPGRFNTGRRSLVYPRRRASTVCIQQCGSFVRGFLQLIRYGNAK